MRVLNTLRGAMLSIAVVNPDETRFGPVDLVVAASDNDQAKID